MSRCGCLKKLRVSSCLLSLLLRGASWHSVQVISSIGVPPQLRGEPKTEATSSYSMDNNMLTSIRQRNRVIRCNACHDICMSPVCCFEVASGSRSSQSLACCRALEHRDLYILFARPPAASSTSLTCLADAAVCSDFSFSHIAKSTAVY